ncbi:4-hydroxythreonine-4-phosphate dehydrogenase PdxA [Desulfovibrio inopinatus]|uniref:4-hydroxythreonine-4-phosphate dehydrogenase PdxA n=1 Tax=Desulfovibrio inopinatus TaxID=102109 RepID=UPI00041B8C69|nr:4-hydroxythreonine-4-phosphate dehydrogenase PdxA [Desulfovibrio inopinatus]
MKKPLLLTLGDPNGLGPELVCRAFMENAFAGVSVVLIGPEQGLAYHAQQFGIDPFWRTVTTFNEVTQENPSIHLLVPKALKYWQPNIGEAVTEGGVAAGISLETACRLLAEKRADAIMTCPLNKALLNDAGFLFPGHTEFLAERSGVGADNVCMHLCGDVLRVSLVTTHPPLREVPNLITKEKILRCLKLTAEHTQRLDLTAPLAVCGLNPHAGESGKIGREEIDTIIPAVKAAQEAGIDAVGPLPADTVFFQAAQGKFSAVLAMYHDQGLAPLKLLHFHEAVNVTLGLPYVRVSVDHGTGYDLVGTGKASLGSFNAALRLAQRLVSAKTK